MQRSRKIHTSVREEKSIKTDTDHIISKQGHQMSDYDSITYLKGARATTEHVRIKLIYDLAFLGLDIHQGEMKEYVHSKTCT